MIQPQNASRFSRFISSNARRTRMKITPRCFPLYGHLQNRLFRDEIFFVLFPVYGESRKRDVVTDNYLYPFFHLRHGEACRAGNSGRWSAMNTRT